MELWHAASPLQAMASPEISVGLPEAAQEPPFMRPSLKIKMEAAKALPAVPKKRNVWHLYLDSSCPKNTNVMTVANPAGWGVAVFHCTTSRKLLMLPKNLHLAKILD